MKKTLWIVVAVMALLAAMIAVSQMDEELSEEAIALLELVEDGPAESKAYLYLLGMKAAPDADPLQVGRALLEEYGKLDRDSNYRVAEYDNPGRIPVPGGDLFCRFSEDCISTIFTSAFDIEALQQEHAVLLARVEKFHGFGEYRTMSRPSFVEPFPDYIYVSHAERIWVLKAIALHKEGNSEQALELLMQRLQLLRNTLRLQDHLIGKMVFAIKISEIIDTASIIATEYGKPLTVEPITSLSVVEKALDRASAREFATSYRVYTDLDKHPEFFRSNGIALEEEAQAVDSEDEGVPGWFVRVFFKPNMTVNAIVPDYLRWAELSKLSPGEFATELAKGEKADLSTSKIRNYAGHLLISVGRPNMDDYVGRIMDLEVKIELFNRIHHQGVAENKVVNPYYDYEYSYRKDKSVCFRGPLEDVRGMRCLRTSY